MAASSAAATSTALASKSRHLFGAPPARPRAPARRHRTGRHSTAAVPVRAPAMSPATAASLRERTVQGRGHDCRRARSHPSVNSLAPAGSPRRAQSRGARRSVGAIRRSAVHRRPTWARPRSARRVWRWHPLPSAWTVLTPRLWAAPGPPHELWAPWAHMLRRAPSRRLRSVRRMPERNTIASPDELAPSACKSKIFLDRPAVPSTPIFRHRAGTRMPHSTLAFAIGPFRALQRTRVSQLWRKRMYEKMVRLALVAVVIPAALVAAGCSSNPPPPPPAPVASAPPPPPPPPPMPRVRG